MDDPLQIRLLHRDGFSARQIAGRLGHGRDTIRKALLNASPPPYTRTVLRECPKLTSACRAVYAISVGTINRLEIASKPALSPATLRYLDQLQQVVNEYRMEELAQHGIVCVGQPA